MCGAVWELLDAGVARSSRAYNLDSLHVRRSPSASSGVPRILHYGLLWHLQYHKGAWSFDKHW
jgi:hypothetical protein